MHAFFFYELQLLYFCELIQCINSFWVFTLNVFVAYNLYNVNLEDNSIGKSNWLTGVLQWILTYLLTF